MDLLLITRERHIAKETSRAFPDYPDYSSYLHLKKLEHFHLGNILYIFLRD